MMRMRTGMGVALLAAVLVAGCKQAGEGGGATKSGERSARARADSIRDEQQALIDSGVTVDTQVVDTGGPRTAPAVDN